MTNYQKPLTASLPRPFVADEKSLTTEASSLSNEGKVWLGLGSAVCLSEQEGQLEPNSTHALESKPAAAGELLRNGQGSL